MELDQRGNATVISTLCKVLAFKTTAGRCVACGEYQSVLLKGRTRCWRCKGSRFAVEYRPPAVEPLATFASWRRGAVKDRTPPIDVRMYEDE